MLRAGELRHRIDIETDSGSSRNAYGETTASWETFKTNLPAKVEPLTGRDLFNAQQVQPDITHKVTIRYTADLTAKMRVIFGERTFHVEGPPKNYQERNIFLEMMCREAP